MIFVKSFAGLVSVYKNTHTGLKCLNANYVMPHSCRGEGGHFFKFRIWFFFFYDLHLQIIANISPKASVENSSAQWAIFFWKEYYTPIKMMHKGLNILPIKDIHKFYTIKFVCKYQNCQLPIIFNHYFIINKKKMFTTTEPGNHK